MFRKTSIGIDTKTITSEEVRQTAESFEAGQVNPNDPNLVWDGTRWVTRAEWEQRAVKGES